MIPGSRTQMLEKLIQDSLTKDLKPRELLAYAIWLNENMWQRMDTPGIRSEADQVPEDPRWLLMIRV